MYVIHRSELKGVIKKIPELVRNFYLFKYLISNIYIVTHYIIIFLWENFK